MKRKPCPKPTKNKYTTWRDQFLTAAVIAANAAVPWTGNDVAKAEWNGVYHGEMRRLAGS
jgi:hypothetical protein